MILPCSVKNFIAIVPFHTLRFTHLDTCSAKGWILSSKPSTRICSRHFIGGMGPTEDNPYPTLFPHNFGLSGTPSWPWPVRRVVRHLPLPQWREAASVNTPEAVSILLVPIDVLDIGCEVTVGDENDNVCTGKYHIWDPITVFGAGFENNLSVGQVAKIIHLSWCCPKLSQILKKSQHLDNYRLAG